MNITSKSEMVEKVVTETKTVEVQKIVIELEKFEANMLMTILGKISFSTEGAVRTFMSNLYDNLRYNNCKSISTNDWATLRIPQDKETYEKL